MFIAQIIRTIEFSQRLTRQLVKLLAVLVMWFPSWSAGEEVGLDLPGISLQGFGTLGMARSDDDNIEFVRDLSQPHGAGKQWSGKVDSLLGIQANVHFSPSTEGVVQVVSRYHADASFRPELTWAFLRHDFSSDFSLRAGRLGTELYMLGDSRLVGYSNISLRPPPDFYGSLVFSYFDGIDVSATQPLTGGLLKAKLFAGRSPEKSPFYRDILWDLRGSGVAGAYLDYQKGPWQLRVSLGQVRFKREPPIDETLRVSGDPLSGLPYLALVPEMAMTGQRARFGSLGLVFDQGPFNVQFMLNHIKHDSPAYADSKAGYVLAAYRFGAVIPYAGISRTFTDNAALPSSFIPVVDAVTRSLVSQSYIDQHTYTLGGRWDLQKNLAVKAEVDWIRGTPASVSLFKDTLPGWDGKMTVFSLALDFVF